MVSLRLLVAMVASLALVPVGWFILERASPVVALSVASVLLVAWSLAVLFGPADDPRPGTPD